MDSHRSCVAKFIILFGAGTELFLVGQKFLFVYNAKQDYQVGLLSVPVQCTCTMYVYAYMHGKCVCVLCMQ